MNEERKKHTDIIDQVVRKQERDLLQSANLIKKLNEDRKRRDESMFRRQKKAIEIMEARREVALA